MKRKGYGTIIAVLGIVAFTGPARRLFQPGAEATLELLGHPTSQPAYRPRLVEAYGRLPLSFEANQGQTDQRVRFLARGRGYSLFLTRKEAVLALERPVQRAEGKVQRAKGVVQGSPFNPRRRAAFPGLNDLAPQGHPWSPGAADAGLDDEGSPPPGVAAGNGPATATLLLRMQLVGANPKASISGMKELTGKSNYFIGNDPKKWCTNVPNYARVRYANVYPGVDLVYYGDPAKADQLEYDFVVQPGADPSRIMLDVGTESMPAPGYPRRGTLDVATNGDRLVGAEGGEVVLQKPTVYQPSANYELGTSDKQVFSGKYVLVGTHRVGFQVAAYDHSKPLVIDPTLVYSTYLGAYWDKATGIAVDASGNAYVTGKTFSANFPTTAGAFKTGLGGTASDAFVSKLNGTGSALIYSTYLGGSSYDEGSGIAVDASGNAYVTGWTASGNFPTTAGAFQTTFGEGYDDAFVSKLNGTGSALIYSTYLGGSSYDEGHGIAVDASGKAYVTGLTYSSDFPTTAGAFQSALGGFDDAFVSKLNPAGSALLYSTYLGGSSYDEGDGIAVDASGDAYVTGLTYSSDFPITAGAFQTKSRGGFDAFVSRLNADGSTLYATYLGGSRDDFGFGIAVDASGKAYVTGRTYSSNFPTTAGAFQATPGGGYSGGYDDAFVVKLNAAGTALVYSTYLGGSGDDVGYGIAVEASGNASVTGETYSSDFPTTPGAFQTILGGFDDAFVSKLNPAGSALLYSTYLGGNRIDEARGIAIDALGNAYVAGWTGSGNFPTTAGAFQTTRSGTFNAFVAKVTAR
jgi:Beta-propeller repeat